ncbi:hypothetical protein HFU84_06830 [Acidithiobacillus sp. CV18-2]|nr:hypothetical protein [Acidithiobacillus sp. CV18-3]MBU2757498.1 hypothetical protein [Acidithiobacillus sp. BN09-2]MBU2777220.1 hypothetical protein [Acidithiobacillus sp. CV18-2]MBU2799930.1 hypothetical protein [Acidithiobacillus sp. VAN18-4]
MRRMSNLAFNQDFPAASGRSGLKAESPVVLGRDRENPYDVDAVGVWLEDIPGIPLGWLYRKDSNRPVVLQALDRGATIQGRIVLRTGSATRQQRQKAVLYWL